MPPRANGPGHPRIPSHCYAWPAGKPRNPRSPNPRPKRSPVPARNPNPGDPKASRRSSRYASKRRNPARPAAAHASLPQNHDVQEQKTPPGKPPTQKPGNAQPRQQSRAYTQGPPSLSNPIALARRLIIRALTGGFKAQTKLSPTPTAPRALQDPLRVARALKASSGTLGATGQSRGNRRAVIVPPSKPAALARSQRWESGPVVSRGRPGQAPRPAQNRLQVLPAFNG
jgi:hypothetical protein